MTQLIITNSTIFGDKKNDMETDNRQAGQLDQSREFIVEMIWLNRFIMAHQINTLRLKRKRERKGFTQQDLLLKEHFKLGGKRVMISGGLG